MSNFDSAIAIVLEHEGGYVNDPNDPGGATNFGISLRFLKSIGELSPADFLEADINDDGIIDKTDIRQLTKPQAIEFYRTYWWDKYKYSNISSQKIATKIFDLAVNMGSLMAHKCAQRAVRAANNVIYTINKMNLADDGILGDKSFAAINGCDDSILLAAVRSEAAGFYRSLNKPKYINGWLKRAYS